MSIYYILGTNKKLNKKNDVFDFKEYNVNNLKKYNAKFLDENFYYLINFHSNIGYYITNINDFNNDSSKLYFAKFLNKIEQLLDEGYEISLQQFVESNGLDKEENHIYYETSISVDINQFPEDVFLLDFNCKYIFVKGSI